MIDYDSLAPVISHMAKTGEGTDACLAQGCLPMRVHYYSPVPNIADLEQRAVWERCSPMSGIEMHHEEQVELLKKLAVLYANECNFPAHPTSHPEEFYTHNESFSYLCAASTHYLIRAFMPERVIEVGSGYSSRVISRALSFNNQVKPSKADYTVVDPYPRIQSLNLSALKKIITQKVELLPGSFFSQLQQNDILFIDSSHTVRTGGDVNALILDILPNLAPGVLIHFHDIPLPFEYSRSYFTNPKFRVFWTEAYLLQAFLSFNTEFEVLLAMLYLENKVPQLFQVCFPYYKPGDPISGSFWIRRCIKKAVSL